MKKAQIQLHHLKIAILGVLLLLLGNNAWSQTAPAYSPYAFVIPLTLNNSSLGITNKQTNFVALVKVTSPNLITGVCQDATGSSTSIPNFAILDATNYTGSELHYQVENYNSATGVIYFWVNIPTLYASSGASAGTNKLWCYFGPVSTPTVSHTANWQKLTWSNCTSTNVTFSGVWHFNDDPAGTAPQFADATVNNNDLTSETVGTVTQNTSSQIGNGITMVSTAVLDQGAINMPNTQASQSMSIWASYPSTPGNTNLIVLENSTNPAASGNGTQLGTYVSGTPDLQVWPWAHRTTPLVKYASAPSAVVWHHYVYTYNSGTNTSIIYLDGAQLASSTSQSPETGTVDMVAFGDYINNTTHAGGGQVYTGTMDESHVIGVTLSADWVKAEYVNQKSPDAFTTAGTMQTNDALASTMAGYLSYTWKGGSTAVTTAANWDNTTSGETNQVPINGNVNWVLPSGLSKYPVLTADASVYALTMASGASINLNGHTLNVGCNIYNSSGGQILYASNTASTINWDGSITSQYYYGNSTANTAQTGSMVVNNSVGGTVNITGGPFDIFNLLSITKGNLVIDPTATVTLKSAQTLTASVTAIPSAYSISGNVSVERYISGGSNTYRGYRFLSSPIYTASVGSTHYWDLSYLPLFAPITGSLGTAGGLSKSGNPSMYLYRDNVVYTNKTFNTGNFRGINKINNSPLYSIGVDYDGTYNLTPGTGILFFYRGNLTNIANKYTTTTSAESTTFVSTGNLNQQNITVTNWYTGLNTLQCDVVAGNAASYFGYNLVGNPYACSIDWTTSTPLNASPSIICPNVGKTIYIYNETTKLYATFDGTTGTNGGSKVIPSGQGFFVKTTAPGASLTFTEAAKITTQLAGNTTATGSNDLLLNAKALPAVANAVTGPKFLRLELDADSINKAEAVIRLDQTANNKYVENEDSQYFVGNGIIGFSTLTSDGYSTAINVIPYPNKSDAVNLDVTATGSGLYTLNMTEMQNIPPIFDVWLMDNYRKDSLDIKHNPRYAFNIDLTDTNTFGKNRFQIVIRQNPALGVHLLNFTATKVAAGANTVWKTENEDSYTNFTVERSTDKGVTYDVLGGLTSASLGSYNFLDKTPATGDNMYRLKIEDLNGAIIYSKVITLTYGTQNNPATTAAVSNINVYPNPAVGTINLSINTPSLSSGVPPLQTAGATGTTGTNTTAASSYGIKIITLTGAVIKTATSATPAWQDNISGLTPGTYLIEVVNNNDKSVVGKSKFVKL